MVLSNKNVLTDFLLVGWDTDVLKIRSGRPYWFWFYGERKATGRVLAV